MRRLLVPPLLAAAAALAHAEEAPGACASAIVVDGRLLFGNAVQHPNRLPPREGARDAIFPACHDGGPIEEDHEGTVMRLRGVPPRIAVTGARPDSVYVDEASLTVVGTHPLHAAFRGRPGAPSYRSGRDCQPYRTVVRGRVTEDGVLRIRTARRTCSSASTRRRGSRTGPSTNPCWRASGSASPRRAAGRGRWRTV